MVKKVEDKVVPIAADMDKIQPVEEAPKKQNLKVILKEHDFERPIAGENEWDTHYEKREIDYTDIKMYSVSANFLTVIKSNGEAEHFNIDGVYAIVQSFVE